MTTLTILWTVGCGAGNDAGTPEEPPADLFVLSVEPGIGAHEEGCAEMPTPDDLPFDYVDLAYWSDDALGVRAAVVEGSLGPVWGFSSSQGRVWQRGSMQGGQQVIEILALGIETQWAVRVVLSSPVVLGGAALPAGARTRLDPLAGDPSTSPRLIGWSGATNLAPELDADARDLELRVSEGSSPGSVTVAFAARMELDASCGGGDELRGSFELDVVAP